MFLLTLVAACVAAWYARPVPKFERLDGGWWIGLPPGRNTGPFVVHDRYGRTVCEGQLTGGYATGTWTYYDDDGRIVWSGQAHGSPIDKWTAWSSAWRRTAEFQFPSQAEQDELAPVEDHDWARPHLVNRPDFTAKFADRSGQLRPVESGRESRTQPRTNRNWPSGRAIWIRPLRGSGTPRSGRCPRPASRVCRG